MNKMCQLGLRWLQDSHHIHYQGFLELGAIYAHPKLYAPSLKKGSLMLAVFQKILSVYSHYIKLCFDSWSDGDVHCDT
jgi:hypothetical protein